MIWHFAIRCYYFINQFFNDTISIMQTTTADSQSTHWLSGGGGWADVVAAAGQQGFPHPQGSRQSRQLWQGLRTTVPSSWFTGFLLCPGAVICPTKAMWALKALPFLWPQTLLPLLMNDSDFRPLYAFFLLTNERLWPEETPRLFFCFCFVHLMWTILLLSSFPTTATVTWIPFPTSTFFLTNRTRLTSSG